MKAKTAKKMPNKIELSMGISIALGLGLTLGLSNEPKSASISSLPGPPGPTDKDCRKTSGPKVKKHPPTAPIFHLWIEEFADHSRIKIL